MFWVSLIVIIFCICLFILTYCVDVIGLWNLSVQSVDSSSIQEISEEYVNSLGIEIDVPIEYRFVRYLHDNGYEAEVGETIVLGTFHVWNGTYYIDISVDLYKSEELESIVIHETKHMIVEYLRENKIINLNKYTEEIAQEKNHYYNSLFDSGVQLLKEQQKKLRSKIKWIYIQIVFGKIRNVQKNVGIINTKKKNVIAI